MPPPIPADLFKLLDNGPKRLLLLLLLLSLLLLLLADLLCKLPTSLLALTSLLLGGGSLDPFAFGPGPFLPPILLDLSLLLISETDGSWIILQVIFGPL